MEALLQGDLSGIVLNPMVVHFSHGIWMITFVGRDCTPAMVHFYARQVQIAWEHLAELFTGGDNRVCFQAAAFVASGHIYMRMPQTALLYIQKSCKFIEAGKLRFVPTRGRPPRFSEDLHETLAALSQTIYWANYLFLMCGGPEPHATADLEKQFRQELPVSKIVCPCLH